MALRMTGAPDEPELADLPWSLPLRQWPADRLVGLPRGISRHVVRFVRVQDSVYAVKEIGGYAAHREYAVLRRLERLGVPSVVAVGIVDGRRASAFEVFVHPFVRFVRDQENVGARELEAVAEEEGADAVRLLDAVGRDLRDVLRREAERREVEAHRALGQIRLGAAQWNGRTGAERILAREGS